MAKSREHVTCNGRAVFYACCWQDLREKALDCGWALALHGSMNSDMDIMAMPWTEDAKPADYMIGKLTEVFWDENNDQDLLHHVIKTVGEKPNGRVVYTLPIFDTFYLDINVIDFKATKKFLPYEF